MQFMLVNHSEETAPLEPGSPEFQAQMGRWMEYNQILIDGGHWIDGASLAPSTTATTVEKAGGAPTIVDGPFAETKEQLGGFYLIEAADLDEALRLAGLMPLDDGSIEVRPVAFRPEV